MSKIDLKNYKRGAFLPKKPLSEDLEVDWEVLNNLLHVVHERMEKVWENLKNIEDRFGHVIDPSHRNDLRSMQEMVNGMADIIYDIHISVTDKEDFPEGRNIWER